MRTTVTLDDDIARAVENLRKREGLRTSEAVNLLARRGLAEARDRRDFVQTVSSMGRPMLPLDNVAEVLDLLEGDTRSA